MWWCWWWIIAEVWHLQGLGTSATSHRVEGEHRLEQCDQVLGDGAKDLLERHLGRFLELEVVGQTGQAGPLGFGGKAEHVEYFGQLVDVGLPGKEWIAKQQLGDDTAHRPDVDAGAVHASTEKQLGRSIPSRHNLVRVWSCW